MIDQLAMMWSCRGHERDKRGRAAKVSSVPMTIREELIGHCRPKPHEERAQRAVEAPPHSHFPLLPTKQVAVIPPQTWVGTATLQSTVVI